MRSRADSAIARLLDQSLTTFTARSIPNEYRYRSQAIIVSTSPQRRANVARSSCAGLAAGDINSSADLAVTIQTETPPTCA